MSVWTVSRGKLGIQKISSGLHVCSRSCFTFLDKVIDDRLMRHVGKNCSGPSHSPLLEAANSEKTSVLNLPASDEVDRDAAISAGVRLSTVLKRVAGFHAVAQDRIPCGHCPSAPLILGKMLPITSVRVEVQVEISWRIFKERFSKSGKIWMDFLKRLAPTLCRRNMRSVRRKIAWIAIITAAFPTDKGIGKSLFRAP